MFTLNASGMRLLPRLPLMMLPASIFAEMGADPLICPLTYRLPTTCSLACGVRVPIPTFEYVSIRNVGVIVLTLSAGGSSALERTPEAMLLAFRLYRAAPSPLKVPAATLLAFTDPATSSLAPGVAEPIPTLQLEVIVSTGARVLTLSAGGSRALDRVPVAMLLALRLHRAAPSPLNVYPFIDPATSSLAPGVVEPIPTLHPELIVSTWTRVLTLSAGGNRALDRVPVAMLLALRLHRAAPSPLKVPAATLLALTDPATSSLAPGVVEPIPTLQPELIVKTGTRVLILSAGGRRVLDRIPVAMLLALRLYRAAPSPTNVVDVVVPTICRVEVGFVVPMPTPDV